MSDHEKHTCDHGISFKCMHSKEAIEMLLSHAPLRYSIKEISGMTDFHRNTVRPAVKELVDDGRIHQFGSSYHGQTVSDHYRNIAQSIYRIGDNGLDEEMKRAILRSVGRNIVKNNLERIVDEDYQKNFNHDTLVEALLHLKMSYPFTDMKITEEIKNNKKRTVVRPEIEFDVDQENYETENEVDLKIYPCLCEGNPENGYMCEMVAGALEGGIRSALNADPKRIEHINMGEDDHHGSYCKFYVHATFTTIDEELEELSDRGFL